VHTELQADTFSDTDSEFTEMISGRNVVTTRALTLDNQPLHNGMIVIASVVKYSPKQNLTYPFLLRWTDDVDAGIMLPAR
jgi:hypothetical protein